MTTERFAFTNSSVEHNSSTTTKEPSEFFWEEFAEFTGIYRVVVPVIFAVTSLTGVVGNILVLIVAYRSRRMKTINNQMISFLAVADLFFLIICVPSTALDYGLVQYPLGSVWCKISQYLIYTSLYVTIYLLCLMSLERFFAIVFPLRSIGIRTERNVNVACLCILIFAGVMNIPSFYIHDVLHFAFNGENIVTCGNFDHSYVFGQFTLRQLFFAILCSCGYLLPLLIISILNGSIFFKLIEMNHVRKAQLNSHSRMHIRAAKIVMIVELGFLVCWTPIQVIFIIHYFTHMFDTLDAIPFYSLLFTANCLSYANSCLNPLLYTFVSKEYRGKLKNLFNCKPSKAKSKSSRNISSGHEIDKTDRYENGLKRSMEATRNPSSSCESLPYVSPSVRSEGTTDTSVSENESTKH